MAKFPRFQKLSKEAQQRLILELCCALNMVKNPQEEALLLSDLLGKEEILMIAKRLQIAKLLILGKTYEAIEKDLKVSANTIARVNVWLHESGEGYRLVIERLKNKKIKTLYDFPKDRTPDCYSWSAIKRRFPAYFLLWNLVDSIVKTASRRQLERVRSVIATFEKTSKKKILFKELEKLFQERQG